MEQTDDNEFYRRLHEADNVEDEEEGQRVLDFEQFTSASRVRFEKSDTGTYITAAPHPGSTVLTGSSVHTLRESPEHKFSGPRRSYTYPRSSRQPPKETFLHVIASTPPLHPPTLKKTTSAPPKTQPERILSAMGLKRKAKGKDTAGPKLVPEHLRIFQGLKFCQLTVYSTSHILMSSSLLS
jgi:hypothetical protein